MFNCQNKNIHSIILARGGSKGIPKKNLRHVNGKPLIYWSIKQSLAANFITETWVSSDDQEILRYSKMMGAKIIKRPKKYSTDKSSSESSWYHAISFIERQKIKIDYIVGIQPTSPIRDAEDFDSAIVKFLKYKYDSLFSALKVNDLFIWKKNNKKLVANYNYKKRPRRQDIDDKYLENGSFYIFKKKEYLKKKCRLFGKIGVFEMTKTKSFQIDDFEDIDILNSLFTVKKSKK